MTQSRFGRMKHACRFGNVDEVRNWIRYGDDVNYVEEHSKQTALHYAARYGHADVAKLLIQNGADVNAFDKDNETPLHKANAARYGRVDVAKVLIQNGADVNAVDKDNWTALHFAALKRHVDVAKMLIQNGADVNAVANKKRKWYNENGFYNYENHTPLHRAAQNGHLGIAKLLIQNGADVNAVDKDNETPLHNVAVAQAQADVAEVLIQNGADVNAVNISKVTPLHYAVAQYHVDVAEVLIQNGADVNAVDTFNQTALYRAAYNGDPVFVLQLLCFGAAIDEEALESDSTGLLGEINDRMNLLRAGKRPETSLMSNEERQFMWNLAFSLTIQHPGAAFKAYYTIRSMITLHGIFMASNVWGTGMGIDSVLCALNN